jgi:hypothetical protein
LNLCGRMDHPLAAPRQAVHRTTKLPRQSVVRCGPRPVSIRLASSKAEQGSAIAAGSEPLSLDIAARGPRGIEQRTLHEPRPYGRPCSEAWRSRPPVAATVRLPVAITVALNHGWGDGDGDGQAACHHAARTPAGAPPAKSRNQSPLPDPSPSCHHTTNASRAPSASMSFPVAARHPKVGGPTARPRQYLA